MLTHADILGGAESENWNRANLLLDTVEELELIGPSVTPTDLLVRLFHEEGPRVFDAQPVRFGCSCSADKVRRRMSIYRPEGHRPDDHRRRASSPPTASSAARITSWTRRRWASRPKRRPGEQAIDRGAADARALARPAGPSSDFDLNPGIRAARRPRPAPGRRAGRRSG